MKSCLILGVANVFSNSFLQTFQPVIRHFDQFASITILQIFKNTVWTQKKIDKSTSQKMQVVIPVIESHNNHLFAYSYMVPSISI